MEIRIRVEVHQGTGYVAEFSLCCNSLNGIRNNLYFCKFKEETDYGT